MVGSIADSTKGNAGSRSGKSESRGLDKRMQQTKMRGEIARGDILRRKEWQQEKRETRSMYQKAKGPSEEHSKVMKIVESREGPGGTQEVIHDTQEGIRGAFERHSDGIFQLPARGSAGQQARKKVIKKVKKYMADKDVSTVMEELTTEKILSRTNKRLP